MHSQSKYLFSLYLAVMLFGAAGLFGKILTMHPLLLVWGRAAWAAIFLFILMSLRGEKIVGAFKSNVFSLTVLGSVLALHWVTFFQSIQMANVAVGVLTFSTFPVFTMLLAPFWGLGKIKNKQLFFAFMTLPGVALMLPYEDLGGDYSVGVFWGMLSALSFAVLTLINKKYSSNYGPFEQAFWQNTGAALLLLPSVFIFSFDIPAVQYFYWFLLGTVFTGLSHGLYVYSLKGVAAQKASLTAALEPLFGILWALIFLGEFPIWQELTGGLIILVAVQAGSRYSS
jgi:drug/metabolite transporter (DMT)-like permease